MHCYLAERCRTGRAEPAAFARRAGRSPEMVQLTNGIVELGLPADYGPRVTHFGFLNGPNVFGDGETARRDTPDGSWRPYGGHRLWAAPERFPQTYTIDDRPPEVESLGERHAVLRRARDPRTGLTKTLEVELQPTASDVIVRHAIANDSPSEQELACWGITVVRPGGVALIPNLVPSSAREALAPARALALWRYTNLGDPRFSFGPAFTRLRCDPAQPAPTKLGIACERGWFAYLVDGVAFVVRAAYDPAAVYPDLGSSVEVYTEGPFCEVETLGPLVMLRPGGVARHVVRWSLVRVPSDDEGLLAEVLGKHVGE